MVDCNNFFVSCERVFVPELRYQPVAVLSSNDGCIIARSNDIKSEIPMGTPVFKVREVICRRRVRLRSSNFALYSDMSRRVMATLEGFSPQIETYSIDEAFLEWSKTADPHELREAVLRATGIPISIGVAPTRTLAKAASELAKYRGGVMDWSQTEEAALDAWLGQLPIEEVWGVARRLSREFRTHRLYTAYDLKTMPDRLLGRYSVTVRRMVGELRGQAADPPAATHSKSMVSSRSFKEAVKDQSVLGEALSTHAAHLGAKLRREGLRAGLVRAFITTGRGGNVLSGSRDFGVATQDSRQLIGAVRQILDSCYRSGLYYKKAGVMACRLTPLQQLEFGSKAATLAHAEALNQAVDAINARWGKGTAQFAAEGITSQWRPRHDLRSPRYTTEWSELKRVY